MIYTFFKFGKRTYFYISCLAKKKPLYKAEQNWVFIPFRMWGLTRLVYLDWPNLCPILPLSQTSSQSEPALFCNQTGLQVRVKCHDKQDILARLLQQVITHVAFSWNIRNNQNLKKSLSCSIINFVFSIKSINTYILFQVFIVKWFFFKRNFIVIWKDDLFFLIHISLSI